MALKDLYEKLIRYYEFMTGPLPMRDAFRDALMETVDPEDLMVFFRMPLLGPISHDKLARKAGLFEEELEKRLKRLAGEGFILTYSTDNGKSYERGNPVFMTEQQVRKPEDTSVRRFFAEFFNSAVEGNGVKVPTRTPYFRALPVEETISVPVGRVVPDNRVAAPLYVVSEMIKKESRLIGVAECYCRKTKRVLGEGCDNPLETCFVFNELAETLIPAGYAREITLDRAMEIIEDCAARGLVLNMDNCQENIRALCNCCPDCCVVMKMWSRGGRNAGAPSPYVPDWDESKCTACGACVDRCPTEARTLVDGRVTVAVDNCVGCGLCASGCDTGATWMAPRPKAPKVPRTYSGLYGKIGREALVGKIKNRLLPG